MIFVLPFAIPVCAMLVTAAAWNHPRVQAMLILAMSGGNLAAVGYAASFARRDMRYVLGGWPGEVGIGLQLDMLSAVMLTLTACVMTAAALYHVGDTLAGGKGSDNPVYHLSFAWVLLSLNGLFLTHDLFNFYVFFELLAVSSYTLVAMGKYEPYEASWKYAVQSITGSTMLLIGVAIVYSDAGTLHLSNAGAQPGHPYSHAAPFFLSAFLLKGSLFPFHFWQQDAHAAATSAGSAILAGLLINVGMYGILRIWPPLFGTAFDEGLIWLGAGSILFGAVAAWRQQDAKRLLGFSSVSQMGFVLLGVGWGTVGASAAALLFLVHHGLSKALLFLCTGALADPRGSAQLHTLRGAGRGLPWLQVAFLVGALSLVGLPPTLGLIGKLALLVQGVGRMQWPEVTLILGGSVLTLGYMSRMHRIVFWEAPADDGIPSAVMPAGVGLAIAWLTLVVLLGAPAGGRLWELCEAGARASLSIREAP